MPEPPSKPILISLGSIKAKSTPPPPQNKRKRPHSALADAADSDPEQDGQPQLVIGFDQSGGVVSASKTPAKAPLIIQPLSNRDWKLESRKRGKNLLPAEVQAAQNAATEAHTVSTVERDEVSSEAGLRFVRRDHDRDATRTNGTDPKPHIIEDNEQGRTADDEAMEALLGNDRQSTLVIPTLHSANDATNGRPILENEDDNFRRDVESRPDSCSLEEYAAIPVEDFGAALLRVSSGPLLNSSFSITQHSFHISTNTTKLIQGMGWKEGEDIGKGSQKARAPRVVEKRPTCLGIGAKAVPGGMAEEFGVWDKVVAKGKKKVDMTYSPLMMKHRKTGKMSTEEEIERERLGDKKSKDEVEWKDRRDTNLAIDDLRKRDRLPVENGRNDGYRTKDRSLSGGRPSRNDSLGRDGSRPSEYRIYSLSRRDRSRSRERSPRSSSRRELGGSKDRKHRRSDCNENGHKNRNYDR